MDEWLTLPSKLLSRRHGIVLAIPLLLVVPNPRSLPTVNGLALHCQSNTLADMENQLPVTPHRSVLQSFDDAHVRVLERSVFANQDDGYRIE